ncbi:uncharacterized protein LOC118482700 [Helianthus annuus]|uniref:uncharacterized protein LOC118482700 n=1 Tax=Helianthus annuus TaxID=4232 RepID=UPI0016531D61|nr:uncharacterized protein LOC118482700 [Helianthus annuus]
MALINEKSSPDANANMSGMNQNCYSESSSFGHWSCSNAVFNWFASRSTTSNNLKDGWIIDSGANQHMSLSDKNMYNCVDVTHLNLTVGHPNGTKAKITKIGDLKLSPNVILNDVLFVPEYSVNLLSVHKLSRDRLKAKENNDDW